MGDRVANYAFGTSREPIMLVDIEAHEQGADYPEEEIDRSVDHEVRHAMQEHRSEEAGEPWGMHVDEREAEHGTPFPKGLRG